ncbi:hypothetical protein VR45_13595 [Streptomyces sp. NRRL S-495]|nr:hypothetical protein VR45_13595 [Streptomyces sp. NRRL S-495]
MPGVVDRVMKRPPSSCAVTGSLVATSRDRSARVTAAALRSSPPIRSRMPSTPSGATARIRSATPSP